MKKVVTPESEIIEETALHLAASFYEIGRSSGLQSKHKNARSYAKANMELFIPRALEHLLEMLGNPSFSQDGKDLIYRAIMERSNNDDMRTLFPSDTQNDRHLNNFQLPKDFMEQYFPAKKVS